MFLHIGPFLPLRSSHWMLLHVLSLLLLLVRPSCYFSTTFYITCQEEHSKWKKFFSCCCGKCAPKKPEEDEDAPDLGDLTAEEETEVTKSAWKYKLLHKIGIEKVLMYLNVIRSPFYYTWSLSPCYTPHKWEGVSFLSLLVPYTLLHCCYTLLQACYTTITHPPGSRIHASPRAWLAGYEQPRRLQDQKYPFSPYWFFLRDMISNIGKSNDHVNCLYSDGKVINQKII